MRIHTSILLIAIISLLSSQVVTAQRLRKNERSSSEKSIFDDAWSKADKNKDEQISLVEFAKAYKQISNLLNQPEPSVSLIATSFAQLDTQGVNVIGKDEFSEFFEKTQGLAPSSESSFIQWFWFSQVPDDNKNSKSETANSEQKNSDSYEPWYKIWAQIAEKKNPHTNDKKHLMAQSNAKTKHGFSNTNKNHQSQSGESQVTHQNNQLPVHKLNSQEEPQKNESIIDNVGKATGEGLEKVGDGLNELNPFDNSSWLAEGVTGGGEAVLNVTGEGLGAINPFDNSSWLSEGVSSGGNAVLNVTGEGLGAINPFDNSSWLSEGVTSGGNAVLNVTGEGLGAINPFDNSSWLSEGVASGGNAVLNVTGEGLGAVNPFDNGSWVSSGFQNVTGEGSIIGDIGQGISNGTQSGLGYISEGADTINPFKEEDNLVNETAVNPFKEEGGENKKKSEHSQKPEQKDHKHHQHHFVKQEEKHDEKKPDDFNHSALNPVNWVPDNETLSHLNESVLNPGTWIPENQTFQDSGFNPVNWIPDNETFSHLNESALNPGNWIPGDHKEDEAQTSKDKKK